MTGKTLWNGKANPDALPEAMGCDEELRAELTSVAQDILDNSVEMDPEISKVMRQFRPDLFVRD